jgi:hypothetical protein
MHKIVVVLYLVLLKGLMATGGSVAGTRCGPRLGHQKPAERVGLLLFLTGVFLWAAPHVILTESE